MRGRTWNGAARAALVGLGLGVSFLVVGCGDVHNGGGSNSNRARGPQTVRVKIDDMKYDPETVEIEVGDSVIWHNADKTHTHSATRALDSPQFDTGFIPAGGNGESKPIQFNDASEGDGFKYGCKVAGHEKMGGFVKVNKATP